MRGLLVTVKGLCSVVWQRRCCALLIVLCGGLTACGVNPVTGKRELQFVSEASEIQIGQQNYVPTRQSEGGDFTLDPALTQYINEVGQKLVAVADRKLPYEFVVLNNSVPNAWALPGGKIAVNRGLLTELHNEAELAAVLGHEIVHAAARHGAKAQERGTLLQAGMVAAQVGLAAGDVSNNTAGLVLQGAGLGAQLVQTKYSREQELESDLYGMKYMRRSGYDLSAAVTLQETFVRLFAASGHNQSWLTGLFASHPPSVERVQQNKRTMAELGGPGGELGAERYVARTAALLKMQPAYDKYDQAQQAMQQKDIATAKKLVMEATRILPQEARFKQLLGDIAVADKKSTVALSYYEQAIALDPNYYAAYLSGAVAQLNAGNKTKAEAWLQASNKLLPTVPANYYLGVLARERGETKNALDYFHAAAQSKSEYGHLAAVEFQRADLPQHPEQYVTATPFVDGQGRVSLDLKNHSVLTLQQVEITPMTLDANGRATERGKRQRVHVTLPANGSVRVDAGLSLSSVGQIQQLRFRVDMAQE